MLRTRRTAPLSLVIVATAGELKILVKATVTIPVSRANRPRVLSELVAMVAIQQTPNAHAADRKPEVKVDELVKIPPFQLAIRVAVPFFACLRVTSSTLVSSMKLIRLLSCHGDTQSLRESKIL